MKYFTLFLVYISLLSCDKKKDTASILQAASTSEGTSKITNGLPANTNSINGVFSVCRLCTDSYTINGGSAGLNGSGQSLQHINPFTINLIGQDSAGVLKINNTILKFETTNPSQLNTYRDTVLYPYYAPEIVWSLSANSSFNSFSTTVPRGFPEINNQNVFPAAFSRSQPLTINFGANNINNADSITVQMLSQNASVFKTVSASALSISFTAADLSVLPIGTDTSLFIYIKNYSNKSVSYKTYIFIITTLLNRSLKITS